MADGHQLIHRTRNPGTASHRHNENIHPTYSQRPSPEPRDAVRRRLDEKGLHIRVPEERLSTLVILVRK